MKLREYIKSKELIAINKNLEKEAIKYILIELFYKDNSNLLFNLNNELDIKSINKYDLELNKYLIDKISPQYIIGYTYFFGNKFIVNNDVLIPRKETEEVVEKGIEIITNIYNKYKNIKILDMCTGTGCIGISIKKYLDKANMTNSIVSVSDISEKALNITKENAIINNVNINIINSDIFNNINDTYDVIISNPPYIPYDSNDVMDIVKRNEPSLALYANDNGLYFYKKIIHDAINYLINDKYLIFEIGYNQYEDIYNYAKSLYNNIYIECIKDLEGKDRIVIIKLQVN